MEEPCRIRNLNNNKLFVREEEDTPLRNYEDFLEGGARIQIEKGRSPTMAEIVIRVALNQKQSDVRDVFVNADCTVEEL